LEDGLDLARADTPGRANVGHKAMCLNVLDALVTKNRLKTLTAERG
jgi:hypothetical protein